MPESRSRRYRVVDVFTENTLEGNPLAVFLDGSGLEDETMRRVARELNLSETVFVLPSSREDCAAKLRIFTPSRELPFAGHPTVGTSYILFDEGIVRAGTEHFTLEENIGPVPIRVEAGASPLIWLLTPPIEAKDTYDAALCAEVLGLTTADLLDVPPQLLTAGNPSIFIAVRDRAAVDRAAVDSAGMARMTVGRSEGACVFVFAPTPEGAYSRMFAPEYGIIEDPATGSATGPLAKYMMMHGLVASRAGLRFISEQGTRMGRRSILHVQILGEGGAGGIEVGGHVAPFADGVARI